MEEIWKDIPNYNGYQVSNLGRVRTHNKITFTKKHGLRHWKDRILSFKPFTNSNQKSKQGMGYRVDLWKDGKPKTLLVARLVATTFLENLIDTNMTVNHKDGNRLNNCVNNLEWMTLADNIRYGFENNQYPQKSLVLYNSKERIDFNSQTKASLFLGRNKGYICSCVKYNRNAVSRKTNIEYKILLKQTKTIK